MDDTIIGRLDGGRRTTEAVSGLDINLGNTYDLGNGLQFACGGSMGYWLYSGGNIGLDWTQGYLYFFSVVGKGFGVGPFAKLRWKNTIELTYRGLLGFDHPGYYDKDGYGGIVWKNHQLMLGLYSETSTRGTLKEPDARERKPMFGFSIAQGMSFNDGFDRDQTIRFGSLGIAHARPSPIRPDYLSLNAEANIYRGNFYDDVYFYGVNLPQTALLQFGPVSLEAGIHEDVLFGDAAPVFNMGIVTGAGLGFSKNHSRRYYYRYSSGTKFGAHQAGMRWLLF
jgi:hypothetical protein